MCSICLGCIIQRHTVNEVVMLKHQYTYLLFLCKSQQDALFHKLILVKKLYMFRTDLLYIIRCLNTVYTAIGICHASYVDKYLLLCIRTMLRLLMMDRRSVRNM